MKNVFSVDHISTQHWRADLFSGFTIFLIALPLCIGIALASGAPPTAGLLAGIVGGMIVSLFSSSRLSINGPAAGLIVIVLAGIEDLGQGNNLLGFKYTLVAIIIAGFLQILFGYLKSGVFSYSLPYDVVHGMLCGIGIIIISKQIHPAFGVIPQSKDIIGLLLEIPNTLKNANPYVSIIALSSFTILIGMMQIKRPIFQKIPSSLVAVFIAILLAQLFNFEVEHTYYFLGNKYQISPELLVDVPNNFFKGIIFPDFSILKNPRLYIHAVTIALVASIESVLTAVAIDQMDPEKQKSDMNQELIAKGIGNIILGFIGGLPIIAEVVRSSANVNNGAKTKLANFFHGFFLLVFVVFFPSLIHKIPISALASLLVVIGFRLSIPEIKHSIQRGIDQFIIFGSTVYFVVSHDLLFGVGVGLVVKFILHIINVFLPTGVCFNDFFVVQFEKQTNILEYDSYKIFGLLVFSNVFSFYRKISKFDKSQKVLLDLSQLRLIDRTSLNFLEEIKKQFQSNGGELQIVGLEKLRPMTQVEGSGRKLQSK